MKFGVMFVISTPEFSSRSDVQRYDQALEQVRWAEELGFDSVWFAEHHFTAYGNIPSTYVMAAAAARVTQRVRLGTAVVLLPFYHPMRAVTEATMVDILSHGRLELGLGRGYQPLEMAGFELDPEETAARFDEGVEILLQAWREGRVDFQGRFYSLRDIPVRLRPVQQPHPPLWMAAISPESFRKAGLRGANLLINPSITPPDKMQANLEGYRQGLQEAGHDAMPREVGALAQVHVDEDGEAALRRMERHTIWFHRTLSRQIAPDSRERVASSYRLYARSKEHLASVEFQEIASSLGAAFGTPEQVAEKLRLLRDQFQVSHFIAWFEVGDMAHEEVLRAMELFARRVMPALREEAVPRRGL